MKRVHKSKLERIGGNFGVLRHGRSFPLQVEVMKHWGKRCRATALQRLRHFLVVQSYKLLFYSLQLNQGSKVETEELLVTV
jgi:hypothetical protein